MNYKCSIIKLYNYKEKCSFMEKKLIISPRRFKGDSSVVSVRLPNDLVKSLDEIAEKTGRTRNEIIQKCIEFSVENLEVK